MRTSALLTLLVLVTLGLFASPALVIAADSGGSNPLLDPRFDLGIWTVIIFVILLLVLGKFAWPAMLDGLHKREAHIKAAVMEAKVARAETEKLRVQFKTEMDAAFAKIPAMMDEARRDAEVLKEEMRTKAAADIAQERARLRREIEVARDQALQEIWTQAAQLATLMSSKAIGRNLSEDDHRRLLDEALTEVRERGK